MARVLRALVEERSTSRRVAPAPPARCHLDRCVVPIAAEEGPRDGVLHLGNKGFMLKRLTQLGFRVPTGFILSTELFRAREAHGADEDMRQDFVARIRGQIARLERLSGGRFGDPGRPLLLSVRGGAPISMPGMLASFLNVGINPEIAEGIAATRSRSWAAWDAYRRFLQFWGMSHGLDRDLFDELIREAKRRYSVPKKMLLPPERMRELAFRYRALLGEHGVEVVDDPFEQLLACIDLVQQSWNSETARIYRRELRIADEWGTAVVVQTMVFGNLDSRSGTGVVLTRHPLNGSEALQLYGDFTVQGQGDDVVSGLVETFPITATQRRSESKDVPLSLEESFPAIYEALAQIARSLAHEHGMNHQELEFTFESDRPEDLFILQARDMVVAQTVTAFEPTAELERSRAATGIGVSGGALSGRVAHRAEEIASLKERFPDDPIILRRPDTVPDDIGLVLQADGLLTAIGGATSHAAVVAKRLGKTCVVGCRPFDVDERRGRSRVGAYELSSGDLLSINGIDGSVYLGAHPMTTVRVRGRAQQ